MGEKSVIPKLFYLARDLRSRRLFASLRQYCRGAVLDVGGWDFYRTVRRRAISFTTWTILEVEGQSVLDENEDERLQVVIGDGCNMEFQDERYDTVINIQVLEHVYEPIAMMQEMCRVLKPGGHLIMLVPQTSTLHMIPHHYYNFTRFWIEESLQRNGMEQLELSPLGGVWSSMASHLVYFVFQSVRFNSMSSSECKRSVFFYLLYPLMIVFTIIALPICMILSLGDLSEEPNNHLVVARKPERRTLV